MAAYGIKCIENSNHIMFYKDFGQDNLRNGYYCTVCDRVELDANMDEEVLVSQLKRRIISQ